MTAPTQTPVTAADREAAERWGTGPVYNMEHLAEAFARHRTQAEAVSSAREAALVEALHLAASRLQVASVDAIRAGETRLSADCITWANDATRAALAAHRAEGGV